MNSSNLKARTRAMLIQTKENKISQLKDYLSYAAVNFVLLRDTEFRYNNPLEQSWPELNDRAAEGRNQFNKNSKIDSTKP